MLSTIVQRPSSPKPSRPSDGPGASVGHYLIGSRLGGGAQGVVYKATDAQLDRPVALKFLFPHLCDEGSARVRFLREARAASAVEHRNICAIHDIETGCDGHTFIVMAYYEGPTLKQKLREGPLSVGAAVEFAAQIAEGLAAVHARGVVHRDIKPSNVLVTEHGVRILDFGLATLAESAELTREGAVLGTPAYMSPEQTRGEAVDARSDVWSAGAVLYEMLAGRAPFRGTHPEAIWRAIRFEAPPSLARCVDVPAELERITLRALSKNRRTRFQSAQELAVALRRFQRELSAPNQSSSALTWSSRRLLESWSRRPIWNAVSAACTTLLSAARITWRSRPLSVVDREAAAEAARLRPPLAG